MKHIPLIVHAQNLLQIYYKRANPIFLEGIYRLVRKIFEAIIYAYYFTATECKDDIKTITHSAAIDLIERIMLEQLPAYLSSKYLRMYIKAYLPSYKYSLTRGELVSSSKSHVNIDELDSTEEGTDKISAAEYQKYLSTDGELDEIEQDMLLDQALVLAYNKVLRACPVRELRAQIATLVITTKLAGINLAEAKNIPLGATVGALSAQVFNEIRGLSNDYTNKIEHNFSFD